MADTSYQKHHFGPWSTDLAACEAPVPNPHGDYISHAKCTRCGVIVKCRASTTFWVENKWTSKRPPCVSKG